MVACCTCGPAASAGVLGGAQREERKGTALFLLALLFGESAQRLVAILGAALGEMSKKRGSADGGGGQAAGWGLLGKE